MAESWDAKRTLFEAAKSGNLVIDDFSFEDLDDVVTSGKRGKPAVEWETLLGNGNRPTIETFKANPGKGAKFVPVIMTTEETIVVHDNAPSTTETVAVMDVKETEKMRLQIANRLSKVMPTDRFKVYVSDGWIRLAWIETITPKTESEIAEAKAKRAANKAAKATLEALKAAGTNAAVESAVIVANGATAPVALGAVTV